jgi:hypothetical protein
MGLADFCWQLRRRRASQCTINLTENGKTEVWDVVIPQESTGIAPVSHVQPPSPAPVHHASAALPPRCLGLADFCAQLRHRRPSQCTINLTENGKTEVWDVVVPPDR